jgi:hypothetical protein
MPKRHLTLISAIFALVLTYPLLGFAESPLSKMAPAVFGSQDQGQKPEETLKAPFPTEPNKSDKTHNSLMSLYDSKKKEMVIPLDKPHRSQDYIKNWGSDIVTQGLNLSNKTKDSIFKNLQKEFDPYGFREYLGFVNQASLLPYATTQNLRMDSFVTAPPTLVSEGALQGSYRWLLDIPVTISYYPEDLSTLKRTQNSAQAKTRPPAANNVNLTIRVQIGRAVQAPSNSAAQTLGSDIVIERWGGSILSSASQAQAPKN